MVAERNELTLRIFPELRKECEQRGIAWGEVDLRWGIPPEKSEQGETLNICLAYIEKCRPYFIGMLGERYGWVDPGAPDKVKGDYPWVQEQADKSITELEILHGVLNDPEMATHAFFYFRDKAYLESKAFEDEVLEEYRADFIDTDAEAIRKLAALKERIRTSGFPLHENYQDPVTFGDLVKADLMKVIDSLAPPPAPLTEAERFSERLDREEMAHEAFAASRFGVYIPRQEYFDRLDRHASGTSQPLVVLGDSGSGKSALLAHWAYRHRTRHPDDLVLIHFVGASSESTDWASMLRRFMGEFKRKFHLAEEIPENEGELMAAFRNWLSMAAARGRVVLVIDALNQLEDRNGAPDLVWLPPKIPENIRLVVSTLPGRPLDAVRKLGWNEMRVEPLTVSERDVLITCYLKKYHKEFSPTLKAALASADQSQNPLFLRALLEEIRIHGTFEHLTDQVREYLSAKTVDALYEMILARYEHHYERDRPSLVRDATSLLWAARRGLSKPELMDLLGRDGKPLPNAYWAPLFLAMEHSLVEKDGRITFFHDYLRNAVEHRYFPDEKPKRAAHLMVADYFAMQPEGLRRIEELPWQLAESAEWERLVALLTNEAFFLSVWNAREYDVKRYWVQTEHGSKNEFRMVDAYQPILKEPNSVSLEMIWPLFLLLYETGHLDEASSLDEYLIHSSREVGNVDGLQRSLGNQAIILQIRGDLDGAMTLLKEQEKICREHGNIERLARPLGIQATILQIRGDPDGAMALLKEQEKICRELGNMFYLQTSLCNQATILQIRGDLDGATALLKEQEKICRDLGYINYLQGSLGNQATILQIRGDLDGSMALLKEQEKICRNLGNMYYLQASLGCQALILHVRGDLDGAMALLKEQEKICRDLGNIDGLQVSFSNQALILQIRGNLDGSMALLKEQEKICRDLGNINWLQVSLGSQAHVLYARGDLDDAMALLKEQEKICRDLGNIDGLQASLGRQASILQIRGDLDGSMALLKEQEKICRDLGNINWLQASLGSQAVVLYAQGDSDGAMALLKEQEKICRDLRNIDGLHASLGSQASILKDRGDLDGAMALFKEKEKICRELGNVEGLQHSLGGQANTLYAQGDLDGAMNLHKEEEKICRDLGNIDGLQASLHSQALILHVKGDLDGAMALLKEQEKICRELKRVEGLAYSLVNQAIFLSQQKRHREALAKAEEAYRLASDHGYEALANRILPILERRRNAT